MAGPSAPELLQTAGFSTMEHVVVHGPLAKNKALAAMGFLIDNAQARSPAAAHAMEVNGQFMVCTGNDLDHLKENKLKWPLSPGSVNLDVLLSCWPEQTTVEYRKFSDSSGEQQVIFKGATAITHSEISAPRLYKKYEAFADIDFIHSVFHVMIDTTAKPSERYGFGVII